MLVTAAIITKLLEKEQIKPIIVGGFSLAIYSNENYSTRDIDIVVNERNKTASLLQMLGFKKGNQNYFHEKLYYSRITLYRQMGRSGRQVTQSVMAERAAAILAAATFLNKL